MLNGCFNAVNINLKIKTMKNLKQLTFIAITLFAINAKGQY